jgi:hypothetical protein
MNPDRNFAEVSIDELTIDDEPSFRHVALYGELKQVLRSCEYRFRILPPQLAQRWDLALLLNLTFWHAAMRGDVLVDRHLPADVLAHAAWHHLADQALEGEHRAAPSAEALLLGEAIASAFDLYLVGRLLGHAPESSFLSTQVPAMAEAAAAAGLSAGDFEELLLDIANDPEAAFGDLRELLSDATTALLECDSAEAAILALAAFDTHRFASLLHHYELSNWILHARVHGRSSTEAEARAHAVVQSLRTAPVALEWLVEAWLRPTQAS